MADRPGTLTRVYRYLRGQLGSVRRVYVKGNGIVRRGDLGNRPQTVLMLHGFMQTRAVWQVMEDRLRYDGYGVFSFDLGGLFYRFNTESIDTLGERVAEKIEGICQRYDLSGFHVIGHSKGGIIARHYVQNHGGDRRVRSLITLGSPHHGTPTALLGVAMFGGGLISKSPWEMLPKSRLISDLAQDTFPSHIPLVSVYSKADLVCPYWCSVLRPRQGETSMKNIEIEGLGHTQLCHAPKVYLAVRKELDAASQVWRERQSVQLV